MGHDPKKIRVEGCQVKRQIIVSLFAFVMLCSAGLAQNGPLSPAASGTEEFKFRDMPDSHWAAPAVYKLVNMGVTQGYPDGTFRGTKTITRYETALFLSKLADSLGYAAFEKMGAELKSELKAMRSPSSGVMSVSGGIETNIMSSNVLVDRSDPATSGDKTTVFNYRLRAEAVSILDNSGAIKINVDTMDGGYYGGGANLLTDLIDIEGSFPIYPGLPAVITATYGPGPRRHLFGGSAFPSEYGKVYVRPYPGLKVASKLLFADAEIGYFAHDINAAGPVIPGEVGVNRISGKVAVPFQNIAVLNTGSIALSGDYFYQNPNVSATSATNFKPSLTLLSNPFANLRSSTMIKAGRYHDITQSRIAVIQDIDIENLFRSNTDIGIGVTLAGSQYIVEPDVLDQWSFLGYDPFGRPAANGARRLSMRIKKPLNNSITLTGRGNLDLSTSYKFGPGENGSRLTLEASLVFASGKDSDIIISYRTDRDPNAVVQNTDLINIALSGRF